MNPKIIIVIISTITITFGAYTNILLELGQLRSEVKYQQEALDFLSVQVSECED